jgi:hypothetical protein
MSPSLVDLGELRSQLLCGATLIDNEWWDPENEPDASVQLLYRAVPLFPPQTPVHPKQHSIALLRTELHPNDAVTARVTVELITALDFERWLKRIDFDACGVWTPHCPRWVLEESI